MPVRGDERRRKGVVKVSAVARISAESGPVTSESRGKAIRARRLRHGIKSVRQFAEQSGVSREAITAAEDGVASESTYARLEAWLDTFEEETGAEEEEDRAAPAQAPTVVIRLGDGKGAIVVEGPVDNLDALIEAAERLRRSSASPDDGL